MSNRSAELSFEKPSSSDKRKDIPFTLKDGIQNIGPFTIEVKSEPVQIYISSPYIIVPNKDKEWTVTMHDFDITVSENPSFSSSPSLIKDLTKNL